MTPIAPAPAPSLAAAAVVRRAAACLALAVLSACAAHGTNGPLAFDAMPAPSAARGRDRIEAREIGAAPRTSALEAIRTLRPEYLRGAPAGVGFGALRVIVDGSDWGGVEALETIPSHLVAGVRRVQPMEARMRYGANVRGGVIEVRLLRPIRSAAP